VFRPVSQMAAPVAKSAVSACILFFVSFLLFLGCCESDFMSRGTLNLAYSHMAFHVVTELLRSPSVVKYSLGLRISDKWTNKSLSRPKFYTP